jgi:hypothetical protein
VRFPRQSALKFPHETSSASRRTDGQALPPPQYDAGRRVVLARRRRHAARPICLPGAFRRDFSVEISTAPIVRFLRLQALRFQREISARWRATMGPASSACRASIGSVHTGSAGGNAIEPDHVVDSGRPPRAPRAVEGGADAVGIEQHPTRCAICTGRTFVRAKRNTLETPSRVSPGFMMASYWGSPADRDAASAGSDRHNPQ